MTMNRRDFVQTTGYAALGAALTSSLPASAQTPAVPGADFDIDKVFAGFMKDIGGNATDGGGKVSFTGKDPILRSHFRIGAAMALPAMGAAVGAATGLTTAGAPGLEPPQARLTRRTSPRRRMPDVNAVRVRDINAPFFGTNSRALH